ncbi:MAG TPA: hypothetical protein VIW28_06845, partial [Gemmatimonadales bacterium]
RAARASASRTRPKRRPGTMRREQRSPKAAAIIALVEGLTTGIDGRDGAFLGRKICRLLADAYAGRGRRVPRWVEQLITYYTGKSRVS